MNNQLQVSHPLSELMDMAKMFFESGMFKDTASAAQAIVKIQAGAEMGIAPFAAMNGISIIMGKAVVGAGLIAGKIKGSGKYDYLVMQQDDKACSIDFYQGSRKIGNSTFTAEDAKKAGTKNMDKFPKNMLFARAISNGVKWFCPDVFTTPVYVPEEMGFDDTTGEVITSKIKEPEIAGKMKLSDKSFTKATDRIAAGEKELIAKLKDTYELSPEQSNKLIEIENKIAQSEANPA